jgi:O-antigen/teichoic acid export membrane protein
MIENADEQGVKGATPLLARLKEAGSHTIIYGLGSVLQTAVGFVLIPLYTRYYTPEIYGVLTLLILTGTIAGSLFYLGASSALGRSYYDYDNEEGRKVVVSTSLYISLFGALLQVLLGVLFSRTLSWLLFDSPDYTTHIIIALLSSAITFINYVFFMLLRFQRRSTHVVILSLFSLVLMASLILYLLIGLHLGVMAPILGTLLSQVVLFGILLFLSRRYLVFNWSLYEVQVQLKFGLPAALLGVLYYALDSSDRLFINRYASLDDVGIYSLGYKLGMLVQIVLIQPFSQIWAPCIDLLLYDWLARVSSGVRFLKRVGGIDRRPGRIFPCVPCGPFCDARAPNLRDY